MTQKSTARSDEGTTPINRTPPYPIASSAFAAIHQAATGLLNRVV
ncbi:hypothetical protein [Leptolyngbya ohadii]|nr:hypothetical protein [Leptolyngbya ohadii]